MTEEADIHQLNVEIPAPSGLKVTMEKPYRMLILGDFAGTEKGKVQGDLANGVVELNANNFDEVMKAAAPAVSFTLADPTTAGGALAEAKLSFNSIRDFDPTSIARRLGATAPLMSMREKLVERLTGKLAAPALADAVKSAVGANAGMAWLAESLKAAPPAKPADPGAVNRLLDQLDLGDGAEPPAGPPPRSPLGSLVSAAAGSGGIPAEESAAIRRTMVEIDRRVNLWLNAVMHAPEVQSLESIWRSLVFLVKKTDFRKGVRLVLLHAHRPESAARFRTLLIDPVFDEGADAPDVIVAVAPFGNTTADMDMLDELTQNAASLPAVLLAPVSASFFGVKHAWQVPTLPALMTMFDQWQFAKWKTLRSQNYARMLAVSFGRCLLRAPHSRADAKDMEFSFKEDATVESSFLWAEGVIAAAAAVSASVSETRWPSSMAGYVRGRVEGFATALGGKDGKKKFGPSDTQLLPEKIEELGVSGLNAVVGIKDLDDVLFWNGISAAYVTQGDTNGILEVSLPYQLFAARLSSLLFDLKPHLSGKSEAEIEAFVRMHIQYWIQVDTETAASAIVVQTRKAEDDPSSIEVAVTTTPPPTLLPAGIPVVLGYRVSR